MDRRSGRYCFKRHRFSEAGNTWEAHSAQEVGGLQFGSRVLTLMVSPIMGPTPQRTHTPATRNRLLPPAACPILLR